MIDTQTVIDGIVICSFRPIATRSSSRKAAIRYVSRNISTERSAIGDLLARTMVLIKDAGSDAVAR